MDILTMLKSENIRSAADYAVWLNEKFSGQKPKGQDIWEIIQNGESNDKEKSGEFPSKPEYIDIAFFNAAVLRVLGYDAQVLQLGGGLRTESHRICAFKKGNCYLWFDDTRLRKTTAIAYDDFSQYLIKELGYTYVL